MTSAVDAPPVEAAEEKVESFGTPDGLDGDLVIEAGGQITWAVGGKTPTGSTLSLSGGKLEVDGEFSKGDRVRLLVECEVREVAFKDEVDRRTGQVVGCERVHKAKIVGVERA